MGKYRTTPVEKSSLHKSWHTFERGLCQYCGWYCEDCTDVATCKCDGAEERADYYLGKENSGVTDSWNE